MGTFWDMPSNTVWTIAGILFILALLIWIFTQLGAS